MIHLSCTVKVLGLVPIHRFHRVNLPQSMIMKALKVSRGHGREMCTNPVELGDSSIATHIPMNVQGFPKINVTSLEQI